MPELFTGQNTEHKTVTVANNDGAINASITAEAVDMWVPASLILSGTDMVILYTRTIPIVLP